MDINVTVNNICLLNPDTLNSGEAYIHKLNFNFSEEYTSDLVYRACFTCLSGTYVSPILNNECEIPPEVLENEGIIELGVYAYILEDNTLIKRFSPEHIFIKIIAGSYREGLESEAPTPTEQEQWIDSFNRNYLNKIELFNENAATKTQEFTDVADKAASDINNVVERLEEDVASHVYDGATFIPNVDTEGNISWTNNQDFPNPETRNIRGPQGPQGETGPVGPAGAVKIRMVDELPDVSEAEEGVLYFVPKEETETAEDLYEEYVFTDGRYEFIGSRHISIDLTDYVKFTDYGTGQKAGVIKTGNSLSINGTGQPVAIERTYEQYNSMSNTNFIGKGTLENFVAGRNLETANNKATEINENSTDTEYPSAKAVYNSIKDFSTEEELLSENSTENVEGTELEIDNTIDSRIKLNKLGGNTNQETYNGTNLIGLYTDITEKNGMQITSEEDGSLTLSGTPTNPFFDIPLKYSPIIESGKTYRIKTIPTNYPTTAISQIFLMADSTRLFGTGQIFASGKTINPVFEGTYNRTLFRIEGLSTSTEYNVNIKMQLEEGESITHDYERFVGGTPSPSPDFPQEVKVVTGENVVSVSGKNLCNGINSLVYLNEAVTRGGIANNNTGLYIKTNGKTYTISTNIIQERYRIGCTNSEPSSTVQDVFNGKNADGTKNSLTINTKGYEYLLVNATNLAEIQIEEGSATEYQPYSKTDYPINLGTLELCKINDYADYIYRDNGKWFKHKAINKIVLNGSENWNYTNNVFYLRYSMDTSSIAHLRVQNYVPYSNNFKGVINYNNTGQFYSNSQNNNFGLNLDVIQHNIYVRYDSITSTEDFKTWLSTHNTEVYYPLATPTEEEITDTTLLSQLEDFYNAKTLQEKTIISQENEELPFVLNLDYFTNSIAGNIAGTNYNVDTLIADIEKALEEINGESVGG